MAGVGLVDTEVGHQLHGAADTLGDVGEGAVAKDGRVQGGVEVIGVGDHRAQVFLHQVGVVLYGLGEEQKMMPCFDSVSW